jgi:pantothenate synthetase
MMAGIKKVSGIDVQYIEFVTDGKLNPLDRIDGPTTIVLAAVVGKTRLIDNTLVGG